jgi:hypothetical protein
MPSHTESGSEAPEASDVPIARWVVAGCYCCCCCGPRARPPSQSMLHSSLISVQHFRNIQKFRKIVLGQFFVFGSVEKEF